jgi:hypothetical protein
MENAALFLAIGVGALAGILIGQRGSDRILAASVLHGEQQIRELRCVLFCGRIGGFLAGLPTFVLVFLFAHHFGLDASLETVHTATLVTLGLSVAAILAVTLNLGAVLGILAGKGIAAIGRTAGPGNLPP